MSYNKINWKSENKKKIKFFVLFFSITSLISIGCDSHSNAKQSLEIPENDVKDEIVVMNEVVAGTVIDTIPSNADNSKNQSSESVYNGYDQKVQEAFNWIGQTVCGNIMERLDPILNVKTVRNLSVKGLAQLEVTLYYCLTKGGPEISDIWGKKITDIFSNIDTYRSHDYYSVISAIKNMKGEDIEEAAQEYLAALENNPPTNTQSGNHPNTDSSTRTNSYNQSISVEDIAKAFNGNEIKAKKDYPLKKRMNLIAGIKNIKRDPKGIMKYVMEAYSPIFLTDIIIYTNDESFVNINYPETVNFTAEFGGYYCQDKDLDSYVLFFGDAHLK